MSDSPTRVSAQLDEIRARVEAATPGPWCYWMAPEADNVHEIAKCEDATYGVGLSIYEEDDAAFVAAARGDIPWLLDQLAEATKELERVTTSWNALSAANDRLAENRDALAVAFNSRDRDLAAARARIAELEGT